MPRQDCAILHLNRLKKSQLSSKMYNCATNGGYLRTKFSTVVGIKGAGSAGPWGAGLTGAVTMATVSCSTVAMAGLCGVTIGMARVQGALAGLGTGADTMTGVGATATLAAGVWPSSWLTTDWGRFCKDK